MKLFWNGIRGRFFALVVLGVLLCACFIFTMVFYGLYFETDTEIFGAIVNYTTELGGENTILIIRKKSVNGSESIIDTLGYDEAEKQPQFYISGNSIYRYFREYNGLKPFYTPLLLKSEVVGDSITDAGFVGFGTKDNWNECWMKFDKGRACLRCDSLSYIIDLENLKIIDTTKTEPRQEITMVNDT